MQRFSPSGARLYGHAFLGLIALWTAWNLRDTDGWQFAIGLDLMLGCVTIIIINEIGYRRQRASLEGESS